MKFLLDTNALIDHIAQRQPYCQAIEKLCIASYFGDVELWVSIQSFLDTLYTLRKMAPQQQLRNTLIGCLEFFHPCGNQAGDLLPALQSDWPDVEDYIIACNALHVDADYLITRDARGFMSSKTPVISPDKALSLLKSQGLHYENIEW